MGARLFRIMVFMLVLTGFAQMPIFKRYYIADIPGLGFLAKFEVTHLMHYLFAAVFIAWAVYRLTAWLIDTRVRVLPGVWTVVRALLPAGIILTGLFQVIRNFTGIHFAQGTIIAFDFLHLGMCLAFLSALPMMRTDKR
ncbi:hypothetical protein JCM14469_35160 [Desulfatiferula olefinivorans]